MKFGHVFLLLVMLISFFKNSSSIVIGFECCSSDECAIYCDGLVDCSASCQGATSTCNAPPLGYVDGSCYWTQLHDFCDSWGPWSDCRNYCETRLCNTRADMEIRSCGGGLVVVLCLGRSWGIRVGARK